MNKKHVIAGIVGGGLLALAHSATADDLVIVHHFNWLVQQDKANFLEQTAKVLTQPEVQTIITVVAAYLGVDPNTTSIALAAVAAANPNQQSGQDRRGLIQSPVGYTICYARPSNPNMGSGDKGIETHGDSTFNATVVRVIPGWDHDGLSWYMSVPKKPDTDTRVAAPFDVVMVRADPGWQNKYKNCEPTGEHAWLARNNETHLNVPCNANDGPSCPK